MPQPPARVNNIQLRTSGAERMYCISLLSESMHCIQQLVTVVTTSSCYSHRLCHIILYFLFSSFICYLSVFRPVIQSAWKRITRWLRHLSISSAHQYAVQF